MKRTFNFAKRNFIEMFRDPLSFIFGLGFPFIMLALFAIINNYTNGNTPMFEARALVPGVMVFSYSFIMLLMSLLVSKDRKTLLLKRLYTSPMRINEFIFGYAIPGLCLGFLQSIICILGGLIIYLPISGDYFTFTQSILLFVSQLPMLVTSVFLGILFGSVLNEKSAPAVSSVFISASGIIGGSWMPLDTMGGFETFCRFLPFYPSVYLGRILVEASHTNGEKYIFDNIASLGLIPIVVALILSVVLSILAFSYQSKKD